MTLVLFDSHHGPAASAAAFAAASAASNASYLFCVAAFSAARSAWIFSRNRASAASAGEYAGPGRTYRGGAPGSVPGMHGVTRLHSTASARSARSAPKRSAAAPSAAARRDTAGGGGVEAYKPWNVSDPGASPEE